MTQTKGLPKSVKAHMIVWALFMPVSLIFSIWLFLPSASKEDSFDTASIAAQTLRTAPIGQLSLPGETTQQTSASATSAVPSPKETYDTICAACHATGLLDAPKFGDKAAWEERFNEAGGFEGVVAIAITGKGTMPPKGGASLSDEDFAKVVAYLSGHTTDESSAEIQTDTTPAE